MFSTTTKYGFMVKHDTLTIVIDYNKGGKCWTTQKHSSEIFNVDPHYTGMDATMPLLSATLRQGVGRGNSFLRQRVWITLPSHNGQKISV